MVLSVFQFDKSRYRRDRLITKYGVLSLYIDLVWRLKRKTEREEDWEQAVEHKAVWVKQ